MWKTWCGRMRRGNIVSRSHPNPSDAWCFQVSSRGSTRRHRPLCIPFTSPPSLQKKKKLAFTRQCGEIEAKTPSIHHHLSLSPLKTHPENYRMSYLFIQRMSTIRRRQPVVKTALLIIVAVQGARGGGGVVVEVSQ